MDHLQGAAAPKRWQSLLYLLPAVLVAALVLVTLPRTVPALEAVPERMELLLDSEPEPDDALLAGDYEDGVYTGASRGYGGTVEVQVTVENGRITDVQILSAAGETENYFRQALRVLRTVYDKQTWEVDTISGATYSSRGILGAIQNALTGETVTNPAPPQNRAGRQVAVERFEDPAAYHDGVYTGTAQGFGGNITVEVTVSGGKITAVNIVSAPGETEPYFTRSLSVVSAMLSSNTPNVDTVSGATYSSSGIINAVKRALRQAAAEDTAPETTPDPTAAPTVMPAKKLRDGVYTGVGTGYGGDITVQITVSGGRITAVEVLSAADETPAYLNRAKTLVPDIISTQSTDVDTVSGATRSSNGILEATNAAITKAAGEAPAVEPTPTPTPAPTPTPTPTPELPTTTYADGTYTATGWCQDESGTFRYELIVTVTIENDKITSAKMAMGADESEYPEENAYFFNRAQNGATRKGVTTPGIPSQIVTNQSADSIDAVSGATYTSTTVQRLAQQALAQAKAANGKGGSR